MSVTKQFLEKRAAKAIAAGYKKQKWIEFCEQLIDLGFTIDIYEARRTVSKYITVHKNGKQYRVRFSNHKPNFTREMTKDCDFFVGITHTGVRTTTDAIMAIMEFFA